MSAPRQPGRQKGRRRDSGFSRLGRARYQAGVNYAPRDLRTPWLDTAVRLLLLVGLLVWSLLIVWPFLSIGAWGAVLATALYPAHRALTGLLGGRRRVATALFAIIPLVLLAVPVFLLVGEISRDIRLLDALHDAGKLELPAPPDELLGFPIAGTSLHQAWQAAHDDLASALRMVGPHLAQFRGTVAQFASGLALLIVKLLFSLVVMAVFLHRAEAADRVVRALVTRAVGERADKFVSIARDTTRSVGKGIVGVALIQAALAGAGCAIAGVPASGLLTIVALIACVAQAGPLIVMGPSAIYLFATRDDITPWLFLVFTVFVGAIDNVLKPLLLGKGVDAPMLVVFLGAIGGLLSQGILGLFLGPVVLVVTYQIIERWLERAAEVLEGVREHSDLAKDPDAPSA